MVILKIREVSKAFHRRPVLRNISLTLVAGERLFLVGRNGCGKTTLLKILAGVMRPEGGSGELNGHSLFGPDGAWRNSIAYLGHQPNLYPSFSARDNLKLVLKLGHQSWDEEQFQQLLDRYGLAGREVEPVRVFSEGMLRRLGLIRMAMADWQVGLMDEPGSALDIDGVELLNEAMSGWQRQGRTLFFTSHDTQWGANMSDRCVLLSGGVLSREISAPDPAAVHALLSGVEA